MTDQHPITPPPELVRQWWVDAQANLSPNTLCWVNHVAAAAAQWGADQELEACEMYLAQSPYPSWAKDFRAARRPKPPSLKEQALADLDSMSIGPCLTSVRAKYNNIRRALEALPND